MADSADTPDQQVHDDRMYGIGTDDKDKRSGRRRSSTSSLTNGTAAIKRFFTRSGSKTDNSELTTPKEVSAAGAGATPLNARAESEELEDHMDGSLYLPDDVCKGCGFPRSSSVWCPVTQRHHGTDEVMTPSTQHHSSNSGGKGIIAKIKTKMTPTHHRSTPPETPEARTAPAVRGAGLPPLSPGFQPPPGTRMGTLEDPTTPVGEVTPGDDLATAAAPTAAAPNVRYVRGPDGAYYEYTPEADDPEVAGEEPVAAGASEHAEAEVQYYCYTDESGETFYYAAEMEESVRQQRELSSGTRTQHNSPCGSTRHPPWPTDANETAAAGDGAEAPSGSTTDPSSPFGSPGAAAGGSDGWSSPKKKKSFAAVFANAFKPKKTDKEKQKGRSDSDYNNAASRQTSALADGEGSPGPAERNTTTEAGTSSAENADSLEAELYRQRTVDPDVAEFVEGLEPSDRKKFDKDRKKYVKDLEAQEKKERDKLAKQRKEFTEDLTRERRAGLYVMHSDEKKIKRAAGLGEPV